MDLIKALRKEEALLDDISGFENDRENFYIWWLGQSGFLILYKGNRIIIDPYLSDSLTKKYAGTHKPHNRMSEQVIDPSKLVHISLVSSSHNHTDHLDAETIIPLMKYNPEISMIIPEANRAFVRERLQTPVDFAIGLNEGQTKTIGEFTFHGIAAAHNTIDRDENGNCKYMGYVISFGKWNIYHSGDTLLYDELPEVLKVFSIDLALLPINGNDPSRGVAGNLDAEEAVTLAKKIQAGCLVPCHYDMFTFNTADTLTFAEIAKRENQPYCILDIGGKICSQELGSEQ